MPDEKRKLQPGRFSIYQQVEKKIEKPNFPDFKGIWNDGGKLKSVSLWVRGTLGTEGFNISGGIEDFKDYSTKPSDPEPMTTGESKAAFSTLIESLDEGQPPKPVEQPPKTEEDDVPF